MPRALANYLIRFTLLATVLWPAASAAQADPDAFRCTWRKNLGKPFTVTIEGERAMIQGSLAAFGREGGIDRDDKTVVLTIPLAAGVMALRWPSQGGPLEVGVYDLKAELQGGHPRAGGCRPK